MFADGESAIKRILALVDLCPEQLRSIAFQVLLRGYVEGHGSNELARPAPSQRLPAPQRPESDWATGVPTEVLSRLNYLAKRNKVSSEALADLFDFSADPFTFGPVHLEGTNTADRCRKAALLVAGRSFLATGQWVADWAEVKAMAINQNCYDQVNFSSTLKREGGSVRKVEVGKTITLSADGTKQAEQLLAGLAGGVSEPK